jgi:hypothetical protein
VVDQLLLHNSVHRRSAGDFAGTFAVGLSGCREQCDIVDRPGARALSA